MAVTNAEIEKKLDDKVIPLLEENKKRIDNMEPKVDNHQLILYGDPDNRLDQGMIGVLNDLAELVTTIKSWMKPIALSIIGWALLSGVQKAIQIAIEFQNLQ